LDSFGERLGGDRSSDWRRWACHNQKATDDNKDAQFQFCADSPELPEVHARRVSSCNFSAGIAQSREILKVDSNRVTAVFDWPALENTQGW
jgi:hypothetical protein